MLKEKDYFALISTKSNFYFNSKQKKLERRQKMKTVSDMLRYTIVLFCTLSLSKVDAWGGLFNRFNPSMLSDLGYGGGGSYGKELYSAAHSGVRPIK